MSSVDQEERESVDSGPVERETDPGPPENNIVLPNEDENANENDGDASSQDESENPLAHLPDYVLERIDRLRELDEKREKALQEYLLERAVLEKKYAELFRPMYEERSKVILGDYDEDIARELDEQGNASPSENGDGVSTATTSDEKKDATPNGSETKESRSIGEGVNGAPRVKGVPQFWVCAMSHNETVGELITEDDVDCLEHLTDITCVDREDGKGFTLYFHFGPNDYFENDVITKTYEVPNLLLSDEPLLKNVVGSKIQWKPDRALTFRMIKKKQRGKGKHAGQVRTVQKKEEVESFFRWFEPPEMPSMESMDEEEAERLEEVFDEDYEVAQAFRSHIIPRAVLWFTGQADDEQLESAMADEQVPAAEE